MSATRLSDLRQQIRAHALADEADCAKRLIGQAEIGVERRRRAQQAAKTFVTNARASARRSGLIDKFLQEYGLSTAEGVTLMRLAEALLRTPDAATADALIEDKIEAGNWSAHLGKSPFPLVNVSTRALMFTAAWLDDVEATDPAGRMAAATKALLDRVGEPVIRASVGQAMRIMGEHFVLGQTIAEAGARGRAYKKKGYRFSYDMLGEAALTMEDARRYFVQYADAIAAIGDDASHDDPVDNPGISVKLSALHPRYAYPNKHRVLSELGRSLRSLALAARRANIGFNVDAEEADRLDLSLDLIEPIFHDPLFAGWDGFGVVIQAYQRRAPFVIAWLAALARQTGRRVMVRLVKGAYWDGEIKRAQEMGLESYPVFTRKILTDVSYAACARQLLDHADVFFPQFATHNALTAAMVQEMAGDGVRYELQRLHGMGEALHDSVLAQGVASRIYAPVGGHKELLPYLVRRLLENGANSSFVNQLIDPDLSVDDVVADPVDEAAGLDALSNPAIPAPRDLFSGARLSAAGWDETDPETAERLKAAAARPLTWNARSTGLRGPNQKVASPAYRAIALGETATASSEDVDDACQRAAEAAATWAARSDRAEVLFRAADALEDQAEDYFALACQEAGKTLPDAIAEVREAVDFLRYYADQSRGLNSQPIGVVACISPWNFPLAIFLGQVCAALAAGNAVVAKPAEQTPLIALSAAKLLHRAGVPQDALIVLPGDGPSVGARLVSHPLVGGVVFTGSTPVARAINQALAANGDATLIAETGGVNAMIVDSTALLEQAVGDTVASAFQSAGQRCSACRLVCVQEDVADRFNQMLAGAMMELRLGDPADLAVDIGPVIDHEAKEIIENHIAQMRTEALLIGEAPRPDPGVDGCFVRPIAFEIDKVEALKQEVFGPVLHIMRFRAANLVNLVERINALGYGLTLGVHTRIDDTMEAIVKAAKVGNIYVNRNQIGAVVGVQPFGGEGLSGTGPKAGGPHYLSALQQSAVSDIADQPAPAPAFDDAPMSAGLNAKINDLLAAAPAWSEQRDRAAVLQTAGAELSPPAHACLSEASQAAARHFSAPLDLPGPTGESNRLRLRGRGLVVCLGPSEDDVLAQAALALAAGNVVLAIGFDAVKELEKSLEEAAAPVFGCLPTGTGILALIDDPRVRAAAYDGGPDRRARLRRRLAARNGAITPLLRRHDPAVRYAVERTVTINTTAAGGDVQLLSLPE